MAKQYYNLEETLEKLKVSEKELKQMARDGQIREFRHGGVLHYKVGDVDNLARELAGDGSGTGDLALVPAEDDSVAGLSGTGMGGSDTGGPGLSGSDMLSLADQEPEKGEVKKDDTVITSVGISVFDDQELEIDADPMAKTVLSDDEGDVLGEGATGSGSGLLDLTRESDDTSLGAELLDEIYAEGEEPDVGVGEATRAGLVEEVAAEEETVFEKAPVAAPVAYREVEDPFALAFTGLLIVGVLMLGLVGAVCAAIVQEAWPAYLDFVREKILFFAGGGVGVAVIVGVVGWLMGRQASGRETATGASDA